jgi:hypothetical protein
LANATDCEPGELSRLLRALVTIEVWVEEPDGAFAITSIGAQLREDHPQSLHFWSIYWAHSMRPLWNHLSGSVRTGRSVRKALTGFDGFERQQRDPAAAVLFNKTMVELTRLVAKEVVRAYDFTVARTVVDVGGGYGELIIDILRHAPHLRASSSICSTQSTVPDGSSLKRSCPHGARVSPEISSTPWRLKPISTSSRASFTTGPTIGRGRYSRTAAAQCHQTHAC